MTDLVKQLEELWLEKPQKMTWTEMQEVTDKAAARIAELEAENERILDLLAKFVDDLRAARAAIREGGNDE